MSAVRTAVYADEAAYKAAVAGPAFSTKRKLARGPQVKHLGMDYTGNK